MKKCCECKQSNGEYFSFKLLNDYWICANCYTKNKVYKLYLGSAKV